MPDADFPDVHGPVLLPVASLQDLLFDAANRPLLVDIGSPDRYRHNHIPGAVLVTPAELVSGVAPAPGRLPGIARLQHLFDRLGLHPRQQVVAYDDEGGGWAGRMLWTLDVVGHGPGACLDGGLAAWKTAGLPLVSEATKTTAGNAELRLCSAPRIEIGELLHRLDDPNLVIWDARSWAEYCGERNTAARNGHIPGALHVDWEELKDRARGLRLRTDLGEFLRAKGLLPDREIIAYCQTHHRSGLAYLAARALGYPHVRAYDGSWSEWGNRADTPVVAGGRPRADTDAV